MQRVPAGFWERLLPLFGDRSQKDLAAMLGVTQAAVSRWRTRDRIPDLLSIGAICRTFDVSADWLLGLAPSAAQGDAAASSEEESVKADDTGLIRRRILGMLAKLEKGDLTKSDREKLEDLERRIAQLEGKRAVS